MSQLKPNIIDRFIAAISPAAGLRRMQARALMGNVTRSVRRAGAANTGTIANWLTQRNSKYTEGLERAAVSNRAEDLYANDPNASSAIGSMSVNISGTGLIPQSQPNADVLGITEEQARAFQKQAEWAFHVWAENADVGNRFPFWALQYLNTQSLLVTGDYFSLPVMRKAPINGFSMALQCVSSNRIGTPSDLVSNDLIRDGVSIGAAGEPLGYWIYNSREAYHYNSDAYKYVPAKIGHRPGMLHGFIPKESEQTRGVSVLAPAIKAFKDLSDYLDSELVGALVAASMPVFIENAAPFDLKEFQADTLSADDDEKVQEIVPGQIVYGSAYEKPHVIKNERPSDSFPAFIERVLRSIGAAIGMPYEVIAKDFSKTNYSSARAALLEAWRIYKFYQKWLVHGFCQPSWNLVIEEAWLSGMIRLPKSAPDFYDAMPAYCRAIWIPPRKGHVDPVKEVKALVESIDANLITQAEAVAEMGGDWETVYNQRAREKEAEEALGIAPEKGAAPAPAEPEEEDRKDEETEKELP